MSDQIPGKRPDELTLIVGGRKILIESGKLVRTMDTCADGFTAVMPWEPGADSDLDKLTAPFSYTPCQIYIGGELQLDGILYDVEHSRDNSGTVKNLSIWSKTADIIDSTVLPPYEANNISLTDRCKQQCDRFGIEVAVAKGVDLTVTRRIRETYTVPATVPTIEQAGLLSFKVKPIIADVPRSRFRTVREEFRFSRVTAEKTDTVFSHLSSLAAQRGLLLSCTKYGDLLIVQPNLEDEPVGTIEEPTGITTEWKTTFSGRARYGFYRALTVSSSQARSAAAAEARDTVVKSPRFLTFNAPDGLPGEAPNAAVWRKNKSAADALNLGFPVTSWYAPNKKLWTPNTTVTVVSPTIGLKKGFTFLVSQVEFDYSSSGAVATLQLKPPAVYTTEEMSEPWLK